MWSYTQLRNEELIKMELYMMAVLAATATVVEEQQQ